MGEEMEGSSPLSRVLEERKLQAYATVMMAGVGTPAVQTSALTCRGNLKGRMAMRPYIARRV
jgi:hypothetical protein